MKYQEKQEVTKGFKEQYVADLEGLIQLREQECEAIRNEYTKEIFSNPDKYREDLKRMLGWPLVDYESQQLPVPKMEKLSQEDGYGIYRMHFEILQGVTLTGLFFKMDGGKRPLVITQHGGGGTPEHISGLYGSSTYYYEMLHKIVEEGAHAFAPQLLLWSDCYGVEYDRKAIDARLKRVGSSITAVELYGIRRVMDYFEQEEYVSNFGMVGLSYGGFYTLYTAALDQRIRSAVSCAFFNQRQKYPFADWTWFESAKLLDDAEIACLIYPRKFCIQLGNRDDLFDFSSGVQEVKRFRELCSDVGCDWFRFVEFDGIHEFCPDATALVQLVKHLKDGC